MTIIKTMSGFQSTKIYYQWCLLYKQCSVIDFVILYDVFTFSPGCYIKLCQDTERVKKLVSISWMTYCSLQLWINLLFMKFVDRKILRKDVQDSSKQNILSKRVELKEIKEIIHFRKDTTILSQGFNFCVNNSLTTHDFFFF